MLTLCSPSLWERVLVGFWAYVYIVDVFERVVQ